MSYGKFSPIPKHGLPDYKTYEPENGDKKYFTEIIADSIKVIKHGSDGSEKSQSNNNEKPYL